MELPARPAMELIDRLDPIRMPACRAASPNRRASGRFFRHQVTRSVSCSVTTDDYTYLLCHSRTALLRLLPQRAVVAELGVAEGEFSRQILDLALPSQMHLVDPWQHQDLQEYLGDPANLSNQRQETRYRYVQQRFAGEIRDQRVFLHRAYSIEAAARFPENFFD